MTIEPTSIEDGVEFYDAPLFDIEVDATSTQHPATIRLLAPGMAFPLTATSARRLAAVLQAAAANADFANTSIGRKRLAEKRS